MILVACATTSSASYDLLFACLQRQIEVKMAQLWEEDRLKKEERDRMDREMAIKRNEEMKAILDLQVKIFQQHKGEVEEQKRTEDKELLDEWEQLKRVEEELQEHHRQNEIGVRLECVSIRMDAVDDICVRAGAEGNGGEEIQPRARGSHSRSCRA